MTPRFVDKESFAVVGMKDRFDDETKHKIPQLWARFTPEIARIPNMTGGCYGVCYSADMAEGSFDYMAAMEVGTVDLAKIPDGLEALVVPKAHYAVFTITLDGGDIHQNLLKPMQYIWKEWLPASGFEFAGTPDFESYDERFDPAKGTGPIDVYVPIRQER